MSGSELKVDLLEMMQANILVTKLANYLIMTRKNSMGDKSTGKIVN
jgi:hypothetical protein